MTETQAVVEIDGPPFAYFEVRDNCDNQRYDDGTVITRFRYRTIRVIGPTELSVREWLDAALATIREWCVQHDAFIIWRQRPHFDHRRAEYHERPATEAEIEQNLEPELVLTPEHWFARCRLITSHPLPPEIWARFEVREGEPARRV